MKIFDQITKSIYGPAFYRSLTGEPLSYSFSYYFKLIAILALVATIIASFVVVPGLVNLLSETKTTVAETYPDELEIVVSDGQVSTNVEEPYFILPPDIFDRDQEEMGPDNLLVIDTEVENVLTAFDQYDTVALLTKDSVVHRQGSGNGTTSDQVVVQKIDSDLNFTINEENVLSVIDTVDNYFVVIPPLVVLVMFGGIFISLILPLVWLVLVSLVLWLVYRLARRPEDRLSYGYIYQTSMHAITLGLLVKMVLIGLSIPLSVPFLMTILTVVVVLVNVPLQVKSEEIV